MESYATKTKPVIGYIDPSTGRYSEFASFNLLNDTVNDAQRLDIKLSPDFTRYAVTRQVSGGSGAHVYHAGWVDLDGNFVDVNADSPINPGPFDGQPATFEVIGFDGEGNLYYRMLSPDNVAFKLLNGKTSGPEALPEDPFGPGRIIRDGAGQLVSSAVGCMYAEWLSPTDYIGVANGNQTHGRQIYRVNIPGGPPAPFAGDCETEAGVPLLPTENTSLISYPVVSPDGTEIAFVRNDNELWIVDSMGENPPRQVTLVGIELTAKTALIGWT